MTPTPWPIALLGWWSAVMLVILGTGYLTIRAAVWAETRHRRQLRERLTADGGSYRYFASDREAALWLIADSKGRPKV